MDLTNTIGSRHNERYKALVRQLGGKLPHGRIVLEGRRLVADALDSGVEPELLIFSDDPSGRQAADMWQRTSGERLFLAPDLFNRLADTVTPQGVIMLGTVTELDLGDLDFTRARRIVLLDGLADPGNVGTICRSAEAFGFSTVIWLQGGASPFSRKAARASMGSVLRLDIVTAGNVAEALATLAASGVRVLALDASGRPIADVNGADGPLCLIVGNEAHGLSQAARDAVSGLLRIPMQGSVESLNAAVATAIAMYEMGKGICK